jgi:hypothetical protein
MIGTADSGAAESSNVVSGIVESGNNPGRMPLLAT